MISAEWTAATSWAEFDRGLTEVIRGRYDPNAKVDCLGVIWGLLILIEAVSHMAGIVRVTSDSRLYGLMRSREVIPRPGRGRVEKLFVEKNAETAWVK